MAKKSKADKRRSRLEKADPKKPAKFKEGAAAPLVYDPNVVAEELNMWWENDGGDNFVVEIKKGLWSRYKQAKVGKVVRSLTSRFVSFEARDQERLSEFDRLVMHVMAERCVDKMLPALAGYRCGPHELAGGRKVIIRTSPKVVVPKEGDWSLIKAFVDCPLNLALHDKDGIDQARIFHWWMKCSFEALLYSLDEPGCHKQGHVMAMAGPSGSGKSALQDALITPMLGDRKAKPTNFLLGQDAYNGDMLESEHLCIQELLNCSQKTVDRVKFGENIKSLMYDTGQRLRIMRVDPLTVDPFWRMTISFNDAADKIRLFPLITPDFKDKLLMFQAVKRPFPMPTRTPQEKAAFAKAIRDQLPAYAWWLLNVCEIPDGSDKFGGENWLVDDKGEDATRFGFRDFQHPALADALYEDTPHAMLLAILDLAEFYASGKLGDGVMKYKLWELSEPLNRYVPPARKGAPRSIGKALMDHAGEKGLWEESALKLERLLVGEEEGWGSSVAREARKLFQHNRCDYLLGRLAEDQPLRVVHRHAKDGWYWMIGKPSSV